MINILYLHAGAEMYGADKVMFDLIRNLDRKKYTPYVILPTDGVLVNALKKEKVHVMVLPYPIMRRKYFNPKGIIQYGINLIRYSNVISRIAKKYNITLIHTNTAATLEGSFVKKKLGIPQLWAIHEIIVSPKIMYKVTSRLISIFSDRTVTVSEAAKDHLEKSGCFKKDNIKVIYNGVDVQRFYPSDSGIEFRSELGIPEKAKIMGMIGRVNSWKGQGDFLSAAEILLKKYDDMYAVLAGSVFAGEEWREEELNKRIAASPYRDRIINLGYRPDTENVYRLFDVFVLPSTNPDPLPTVVLEAMACGKPVVAYRHGGVCEMVKEGYNGLFADVCDTADLAKKTETVIRNDNLCIEMGKHSRERLLEEFSIAAYVKNYSAEYDRLAGI